MRCIYPFLTVLVELLPYATASAQPLTAAGQPAQLDVRVAGENSIRVTLKPVGFKDDFPYSPALAERSYPAPELSLREIVKPVNKKVANFEVEARPNPLTLVVRNPAGDRPGECEDPWPQPEKGPAAPGFDRAGAVRRFRFRCPGPGQVDEGLFRHHGPGGAAAEVGTRIHAVAPHARR